MNSLNSIIHYSYLNLPLVIAYLRIFFSSWLHLSHNTSFSAVYPFNFNIISGFSFCPDFFNMNLLGIFAFFRDFISKIFFGYMNSEFTFMHHILGLKRQSLIQRRKSFLDYSRSSIVFQFFGTDGTESFLTCISSIAWFSAIDFNPGLLILSQYTRKLENLMSQKHQECEELVDKHLRPESVTQ